MITSKGYQKGGCEVVQALKRFNVVGGALLELELVIDEEGWSPRYAEDWWRLVKDIDKARVRLIELEKETGKTVICFQGI